MRESVKYIAEGLGALAGGIRQGGERYDQLQRDEENRRRYEQDVQMKLDEIRRQQEAFNRPMDMEEQNLYRPGLGLPLLRGSEVEQYADVDARPAYQPFDPFQPQGLGAPPGHGARLPEGMQHQVRPGDPVPEWKAGIHGAAARAAMPQVTRQIVGAAANETRRDIAGNNIDSREKIAGDKLGQDESQFKRHLSYLYDALNSNAELRRELGGDRQAEVILKALTSLATARIGAQGRVESSNAGIFDPTLGPKYGKETNEAQEAVEERVGELKGKPPKQPAPKTRTRVKVSGPKGGKQPAGKIRVRKGSEVLEIDASDEAAAKADGYTRL
jgi:hypothetical protein